MLGIAEILAALQVLSQKSRMLQMTRGPSTAACFAPSSSPAARSGSTRIHHPAVANPKKLYPNSSLISTSTT